MAQKRIPKKKIEEAIEMEEQINEKEVDGMDDEKEYQVVGTGKSKYLGRDKEYTLKGLQAKLLIKQGKVVLK